MSEAKPVIFISYSHKDEPDKPDPDEVAWLTFVQSFLAPVVNTGIFDIWVDEHLHGGDVLDPEIKKKLADCDIFVLLASRFSLASTYVVETEIATIRQRQKDDEDVHMFPIVLSPVPNAALKQLKDLLLRPKDGKPLSLMSKNDREVAMANIADDIAKVAEYIAIRKAERVLGATWARHPSMAWAAIVTKPADVDTAHLPETPYERLI
jgi:TIR domain